MAGGSNAPFSGDWSDLSNVPTLPEGVTASEATEKLSVDGTTIRKNNNGEAESIQKVTTIGTFENGNDGFPLDNLEFRDDQHGFESNFSLGFRNLDFTEQDFDFTNVEKITYYQLSWQLDNIGNILTFVGGDKVGDTLNSQMDVWEKFSVDVSDKTGVQTLRFEGGQATSNVRNIDLIKLHKTASKIVEKDGDNLS